MGWKYRNSNVVICRNQLTGLKPPKNKFLKEDYISYIQWFMERSLSLVKVYGSAISKVTQ